MTPEQQAQSRNRELSIPHAIPTQPNPTTTQDPQNSNDHTSNHETHPRELHAKLGVGSAMWQARTEHDTSGGGAGLRDDAPSEARGADGERAGRRPRAHKAARPDESGPPAPGTPVGPQATRPGRASQNLRNWAASRPTARSARRAILQSPGRPQCRRRNAPRALPGRPR